MGPPSKFFTKLVSKNAIKPQKGVPPYKKFTIFINPSPNFFAKTLWALPWIFKPCASMLGALPFHT
jgi:hypothetical protein